jgi:predicted CXXCH cytochrome family protein
MSDKQKMVLGRRGKSVAAIVVAFCVCLFVMAPGFTAEKGDAAGKSPYDMDVKPLTSEECGRCHRYYFDLIKKEGGKHQIDCTDCHKVFHVYRPGKTDYDAIMPKCSGCHDNVHGPDLANCTDCHRQPHAPNSIPADRSLERGCSVCHPQVDKEMKTFATEHTELYCVSCHYSRHRRIPECLDCHQPHEENQQQAECIACHPPHSALQVGYAQDIAQEACRGCHRNVYDVLKKSNTKHSVLSCAKCHTKHRVIVQCQTCHPKAHGEGMLQGKVCGACHGIAHALIR